MNNDNTQDAAEPSLASAGSHLLNTPPVVLHF
jgi:hypothetical protein